MPSNIQQWNPGGGNQETDAAYTADPLRSGGAPANAIFPSPTANKLFYQLSTFCAAFAAALSAKGLNVSDANLAALQAVLSNIVLQSDLTPFAPKNSPALTGVPTAPTAVQGTSTAQLATTDFVNGQPKNFGVPGFSSLPGDLVIQWAIGPTDPANGSEPQHNIPFQTPFPNACLVCLVSSDNGNYSTVQDTWYQTLGWNQVGVNVQRQLPTGGAAGGSQTRAIIIAIGF